MDRSDRSVLVASASYVVSVGALVIASFSLVLASCAGNRPPQSPPPTPIFNFSLLASSDGKPLPGATARIIDGLIVGRTVTADGRGFIDFGPVEQHDFNLCVEAPSHVTDCFGIHLFDHVMERRVALVRSRPLGRQGAVRLEGRSFVDENGAFNPLGASLFWALWAERHDAARLDQNLAYLAEHRVDYVRILGMVGTPSWSDRVIDPNAPDYWDVAERLFQRLARHGLRAQVTVFADAQAMMADAARRRDFATAWADWGNRHVAQVLAFEVANESWQNGFPDPNETRELGRRIANTTSIPVALSSAPADEGSWCRLYAGSAADFATLHYDRDISRADGLWRPVRQPWGYSAEYEIGCERQLPVAATSNEPIGPQSSVAEDADPLRLALSYVTTFVSGNAAYVYHAGAGIRGGGAADAARGRRANYFEYDNGILDALSAMRALLPDGLANWQRHNAQWETMPWNGFQAAVEDGRLMRAYAATSGGNVVLVLLKQSADISVTARRGFRMTRHDGLTGAVISVDNVPAGSTWTVPASRDGSVFLGSAQ